MNKNFIPVWIRHNYFSLIAGGLFFVFALFFLLKTSDWGGGELFAAQKAFAPSTPPGDILYVQLSQLFLWILPGPLFFRTQLFNLILITCSLVLFYQIVESVFESHQAAIFTTLGIASSVFVINAVSIVTCEPLTFCLVLIIARIVLLPDFSVDSRYSFVIFFLAGLGIFGLNSSFRLIFPLLFIYWSWLFTKQRLLFLASPVFFFAGFGIVFFLVLASHRNAGLWSLPHNLGTMLAYSFSRPVHNIYQQVVQLAEPFTWLPSLKILFLQIEDNFPFFLLPLVVVGWIYFLKHKEKRILFLLVILGFLQFFNLVLFDFYRLHISGPGFIVLSSLWISTVAGVEYLVTSIKINYIRQAVAGLIMLTGVTYTILVSESRVEFPPPAAPYGITAFELTQLPADSTLILPDYNLDIFLKARFSYGLGEDLKLISPWRTGSVSDEFIKKTKKLYVFPNFNLPTEYRLIPANPFLAKVISRETFIYYSLESTQSIYDYYARFSGKSLFLRRWAARNLSAWGQLLLEQGYLQRAATFANLAFTLSPLCSSCVFLESRLLAARGFYQAARARLESALQTKTTDFDFYDFGLNLVFEFSQGVELDTGEEKELIEWAETMAEKALRISSKHSLIHYKLARVYYGLNRREAALENLRKAILKKRTNKVARKLLRKIKRNK
ncbi:MAG: tetratricopeptide repeat protein [Myxococcota bacterium]